MILIGIDPDVEKNGVAIQNENNISLSNLTFFELFETLKDFKNKNVKVYVERGELNKSVHHLHKIPTNVRNIKAYCAQVGVKVGKNFTAASLIIQMCEFLCLSYVIVKPTSRKLDRVQFQKVTGIGYRTNQEQRDAFMLIFKR